MLTRIEIDGFKTFESFALDLQPFSAIVGPNASGKSNLFDALRFLSLLSQHDVRTAMQDLRGEPEELFRRTISGVVSVMKFAVEVVLDRHGADAFGTEYQLKSQRLRYELELSLKYDDRGIVRGVFVTREICRTLSKRQEHARVLKNAAIAYSGNLGDFITMRDATAAEASAIIIRQDGPAKRGRPVTLPAVEASRTALSTITTSEFPHLYALRSLFVATRFLEINPQAARKANDRFEVGSLKPDASNLAAVLAHLKAATATENRPEGVISDISADLSSLIPSVRGVRVFNNPDAKEYSFDVSTSEQLTFSSRVISDGTLRLLALLAVLDNPDRRGVLCFEEPENGVHEGRIPALVSFLRDAVSTEVSISEEPLFQILVNTHSPAVMAALDDREIIAADTVAVIDPAAKQIVVKTRMRAVHFPSSI